MPKMKTNKTLKKRIKVSKNGKVMKKDTRMGHLKSKLDSSRKSRKSKRKAQVNLGHVRVFKKLLAKFGRGLTK